MPWSCASGSGLTSRCCRWRLCRLLPLRCLAVLVPPAAAALSSGVARQAEARHRLLAASVADMCSLQEMYRVFDAASAAPAAGLDSGAPPPNRGFEIGREGMLLGHMSWQQIGVTLPNGVTITLDVQASDTIHNIKAKVSEHLVGQIRPEQQRLIFADNHNLEDGRTLSHYNIQQNSILHLATRPADVESASESGDDDEDDDEEEEGEEEEKGDEEVLLVALPSVAACRLPPGGLVFRIRGSGISNSWVRYFEFVGQVFQAFVLRN